MLCFKDTKSLPNLGRAFANERNGGVMNRLLLFCALMLTAPVAAAGQSSGNNTQIQEDMPDSILVALQMMGIPPKLHENVYHALEKACSGKIHALADEPRNAYAVAGHECYIVMGRVAQQASKHQSLMVQEKLLGPNNGIYFLGNFDSYSEIVKDGQLKKLDYSPPPGDLILAVGVGLDPFTYDATDGTSMTVSSYAIMLYADLGHQ